MKQAQRKNIEICSFCRADYLALQLLKSALAYTLSFGIGAFLWAGGGLEELLTEISRLDYLGKLLKSTAVLYTAGLFIYEVMTYIYFAWKYQEAKKSVVRYNKHLKHIHEFYRTQDSEEAAVTAMEMTDGEKTL